MELSTTPAYQPLISVNLTQFQPLPVMIVQTYRETDRGTDEEMYNEGTLQWDIKGHMVGHAEGCMRDIWRYV